MHQHRQHKQPLSIYSEAEFINLTTSDASAVICTEPEAEFTKLLNVTIHSYLTKGRIIINFSYLSRHFYVKPKAELINFSSHFYLTKCRIITNFSNVSSHFYTYPESEFINFSNISSHLYLNGVRIHSTLLHLTRGRIHQCRQH
jgi:hypothetical protein